MAELLEFECPRCQRPYELALDLAQVKRKRQRAKCARCGERFDIASRVEAMKIGSAAKSAPPPSPSREVVGSKIAARLAAALHTTTSEAREAELVSGSNAGEPTEAEQALQAHAEHESPAHEAEPEEQEDLGEAELPGPLDWLALAGTGPEILLRELNERERELAALLTH
ncbi:MAG: hypothetical protein GY811_23290 [Myxococcales bacterium]|nr:hypothetical protein [Myxococcales bacterium]